MYLEKQIEKNIQYLNPNFSKNSERMQMMNLILRYIEGLNIERLEGDSESEEYLPTSQPITPVEFAS